MSLPSILKERYEILDLIASGGMGNVYKAHDSLLDKTVAIKVLTSNTSERIAVRFQNEARAFARLAHDNIVTALDFDLIDHKTPYLVMDFIEGRTLECILKENGPLSLEEALPIFLQLCAGVAHAHERGILHRDIKPSNIMIIEERGAAPLVKILDFGVVKFQEGQQTLTSSGAALGTVLYMSPEQAHGEEIDARTDIYSIGCVMFETLSGVPPITGDSSVEIIALKRVQEAPLLNEVAARSHFPHEVEEMIAKCLKIAPAERYGSVTEMMAPLQNLVEKMGTAEDPASGSLSSSQAEFNQSGFAPGLVPHIYLILSICGVALFLLICGILTIPQVSSPTPLAGTLPKHNAPFLPTSLYRVEPRGSEIRIMGPISDDQIENSVKDFPASIRKVILHVTDVRGPGLKAFRRFHLSELAISGSTSLDDSAMEEIALMKELEFVTIHDAFQVTEKGWLKLKELPKLIGLSLGKARLTAAALRGLSEIRSLANLVLDNCKGITSDGISTLRNIRTLGGDACIFNRDNVKALSALRQLQQISASELPESGSADLIDACLTLDGLDTLSFEKCALTSNELRRLAGVKNLQDLDLDTQKMHLTSADFRALSQFPRLEKLKLTALKGVSEKELCQLGRSKNLRKFRFSVEGSKEAGAVLKTVLQHAPGFKHIDIEVLEPDSKLLMKDPQESDVKDIFLP